MHIWVPRTKIIENLDPVPFPKTGLGGRFKMVGTLPDGRSRVIADWQPNLITTAGLDRFGVGVTLSHCSVGSSNTAPAYTDTGLYGYLRTHTYIAYSAGGAQGTAPYYGWRKVTFRFDPHGGGSPLSLAEVGFGWASGGGSLFSRALVKDIGGSPTAVSWLGTETLDVYYELRNYPWLVDVPYEEIIGGTTYEGVMRCAQVTNSNFWAPYNGPQMLNYSNGTIPYLYACSTGIVDITSSPSTSNVYATSGSTDAYSTGAFKRTGTAILTPTTAVSISSWSLVPSSCWWQKSITPALVKSLDFTMTINMEGPTWGRYAP